MSEKGLQEQVAIVTGGARRIGRAISLTLAEAGANVVVHYLTSAAGVKSLVSEIQNQGVRAVAVEANLAEPATGKKLVEAAGRAFGRLDILINNAGIFERGTVEETTPELWDRFMAVNLRAPFALTQAFARRLPAAAEGNVINLIDQRVWNVTPTFTSYTASKVALWGLTRNLALAFAKELKPDGIHVATVTNPRRQAPANTARRSP